MKQLPSNTVALLNDMAKAVTTRSAYEALKQSTLAMCDKNGYDHPLFSCSFVPGSNTISDVRISILSKDAPIRSIAAAAKAALQ